MSVAPTSGPLPSQAPGSIPPPRPRQPNTAIFWILGIIGAAILVLILGGLSLAAFIIHRVHVTENADRVEIETPVGALKVSQDQPGSTGLPVYPGAVLQKSDGANFEITANNTHAGLAVVKYLSTDPRSTVKDWYAKRLGPSFALESGKFESNKDFSGLPVDMRSDDLAFVSKNSNSGSARVVALGELSSGTEIVLIRVGKQEPQ
jgi:hypothetical protein